MTGTQQFVLIAGLAFVAYKLIEAGQQPSQPQVVSVNSDGTISTQPATGSAGQVVNPDTTPNAATCWDASWMGYYPCTGSS